MSGLGKAGDIINSNALYPFDDGHLPRAVFKINPGI